MDPGERTRMVKVAGSEATGVLGVPRLGIFLPVERNRAWAAMNLLRVAGMAILAAGLAAWVVTRANMLGESI